MPLIKALFVFQNAEWVQAGEHNQITRRRCCCLSERDREGEGECRQRVHDRTLDHSNRRFGRECHLFGDYT